MQTTNGAGRLDSPRGSRPASLSTGLSPFWTLSLVVLALAALLSASAATSVLTAAAPSPTLAVASDLANAGSSSSIGTAMLEQATQSLDRGSGPAGGQSLSCTSPERSGTVDCAKPAASSLPSLAWNPVGTPQGRSAVSMVYDAADGYVVLFGNGESATPMADTWIFDRGTWTELVTPVAPSPRDGAYMAYDSEDGYVVLFGGWGGYSGAYEYGDTWAFAGGAWHELISANQCTGNYGSMPCPSPRDSGAMADDPKDGYVVLFGGYSAYNDTWQFLHGKWTLLIPSNLCNTHGGPVCPAGRDDNSLAYDPASQQVILFGGGGPLNDTWAFSGGSWTELINPTSCTGPGGSTPCPPQEEEASLSWDSSANYLVLWGGYNSTSGVDSDQTWAFQNGVWHELAGASGCKTCPEGRSDSGLVDDPALGGVLMFGGYAYLGDTWLLSNGAWLPVALSNTPGPRWDAAMAWDPADQAVLLFGGFLGGSALGDTWEFAFGSWTEVASSASCASCPAAAGGSSLAWDGKDGYMVLFGGMTTATGGFERNTWSFLGGHWTELIDGTTGCTAPGSCPTARANASMSWDVADQEVVLFGGVSSGPAYDNDTWTFKGGAWTEVTASADCTGPGGGSPCPSERDNAPATEAPLPSGGVILFGGYTGSGVLNDTWLFKGGVWENILSPADCLVPVTCPSERQGAAMALDPTDNVIILFGGEGSHSPYDDTWVYQASTNTWTKDAIYGASDRAWATLAYDGTSGNLLLAGGESPYGLLPDVWAIGTPQHVGAPTALPSPMDLGESVTFSDVASGGGVSSDFYTWQGLPTGCAAPTNGVSTFVCTPTATGVYNVSTVVTYSNGLPGATSSSFLYLVVNSAPVVTISSNATVVSLGHWFNLTAVATGGTGTFSQYQWYGLPPDCATAVSPIATLSCHPLNASSVGTWQVRVSAIDSSGANATSAPYPLVVEVAPWGASLTMSKAAIDLTQTVDLAAVAAGASGPFTYTWNGLPPGCSGLSAMIVCTPSAVGSYPISATLSSAVDGSATAPSGTLTVLPTLGATTLTASSAWITVGGSLTLTASTVGGETPYTYAWSGLPTGCLAGSSAQVFCQPLVPGSYSVSATGTDVTGASSASAATVVTVNATVPVVQASVLLSASATTLDDGQATTLTATVVGGAGLSPSFGWTGLPAGCASTLSSLRCTPTVPGTYFVSVEASFPGANTATSNSVELIVASALGPVAVSLGTPSAVDGQPLTISAAVAGGSAPYTYAWSDIPAGCPPANAAEITCVPTSVGSYTVSVTVTDAAGASASATAALTVSAAAAAPSGFAPNATDLDWSIFGLLVVLVLLAVIILLLGIRRRPAPPSGGKKWEEWDEGAPSTKAAVAKPSEPSAAGPSTPPAKDQAAPSPGALGPASPSSSVTPSTRARFSGSSSGTGASGDGSTSYYESKYGKGGSSP